MRPFITRVLASTLVLTGSWAIACGPSFPTPFLSGGDATVGFSQFESEMIILGDHFKPELVHMNFPKASPKVPVADLADFGAFLDTLKPALTADRKAVLLGDYRNYAGACREAVPATFPHKLPGVDEFILYLEGVRRYHSSEIYGGGLRQIPDEWSAILALPK